MIIVDLLFMYYGKVCIWSKLWFRSTSHGCHLLPNLSFPPVKFSTLSSRLDNCRRSNGKWEREGRREEEGVGWLFHRGLVLSMKVVLFENWETPNASKKRKRESWTVTQTCPIAHHGSNRHHHQTKQPAGDSSSKRSKFMGELTHIFDQNVLYS